jgi:succinate dehydrogenase / fumarate reductase cytochrome b subunit
MPYTGLLILCFVLVHVLVNFADYPHLFPSDMVRVVLSRPGYALFYILSLIGLTLHTSHGFWSMFEDLGISHPAYDRFIQLAALGVSLTIGALFILVPCLAIFYKGFLM